MTTLDLICRTSSPKRRLVATMFFSALMFALPGRASAFKLIGLPGYEWPGGVYNYRINVASFQNNLGSLNLTASEVAYWIPYALNTWRERTGVDSSLTLNYVTTSTASNDTCTNHDGFNQVYVVNGCRDGATPPCTTFAQTKSWPLPPSSSPIVEADTCVYGGAAGPTAVPTCTGGWRVRMDAFPSTRKDLIGLLVHEFGHTFGLDHPPSNDTVMELESNGCGNVFSRYPTGDDIDGIRSQYGFAAGGIPEAFFREKVANGSWSAEVAVPSLDGVWPLQASVGRGGTGSTSKVVVTEVSDTGNTVAFNRANYPLTASSTWTTGLNVTIDTWLPPAVSGRPNSHSSTQIWSAAITKNNQVNTTCNRIKTFVSNDAFTTHTGADLPLGGNWGCGSNHEPAIAFDSYRGRFVLFFVRREVPDSLVEQSNGKIHATTSLDGVNWTAPTDLDIWTNDAVDATCGMSLEHTCMLTYIRSSANSPNLVNRYFNVDTNGNVVIGASNEVLMFQEQTPAAGTYWPDSLLDFVIGSSFAANESDRSNNVYTQRVAADSNVPFTGFTYFNVTGSSRRSDLASLVDSTRIYLWYVR